MALLKVSGLTKNFGGLCAVSNVNMEINEQELIGLIGPNGAVKTGLFNRSTAFLLKVVHLYDKRNELASNLPYGEQRRLEIARALATKPKVLFLDEPAAGMNPQETADLTRLIHQIKDDFHLTVILIEHDMSLVMTICERIYVLDYGKCIANGVPEVIKNDKRVIKAYLGEDI